MRIIIFIILILLFAFPVFATTDLEQPETPPTSYRCKIDEIHTGNHGKLDGKEGMLHGILVKHYRGAEFFVNASTGEMLGDLDNVGWKTDILSHSRMEFKSVSRLIDGATIGVFTLFINSSRYSHRFTMFAMMENALLFGECSYPK